MIMLSEGNDNVIGRGMRRIMTMLSGEAGDHDNGDVYYMTRSGGLKGGWDDEKDDDAILIRGPANSSGAQSLPTWLCTATLSSVDPSICDGACRRT